MKAVNHFLSTSKFGLLILAMLLIFCSADSYAQKTQNVVIVTFGNSTTAPRKNIDKVYAVRVAEILKSNNIDCTVFNAGTPGSHSGSVKDNAFFKTAHGLDRFDTAVLDKHPDWVTINFGLNDSWQDSVNNMVSRIPVNKYRDNLSYYIDKVREQNGKVILLTPNPIGKKFDGFHEKTLKKYLKVTRKLSRSKKVPLIDTWKLFDSYVKAKNTDIDSLLLDGIHPGDKGHELIAEAISKIIIRSVK